MTPHARPAAIAVARASRVAALAMVSLALTALGKGGEATAESLFVIDQLEDGGEFDEHKVMLGYPDKDRAVADYIASHSRGEELMADCTSLSMDQFKEWLKEGDLTKPMTSYVEKGQG